MLREHVGSRHQAVDQEGAEQDRHAGAARNPERHGRHQGAAFARVVGAFRRDHAAHVALAEGLRGALFGAHRVPIGEPVDHRAADARHRPEGRADPAAAQHQPPVGEAVLGALPHAGGRVVAHVARDRRAGDREIAQLRQREQAEHHRHQRQAVPEIEKVEGPAQRAGLRIGPDHGDQNAEPGRHQAAQRRIAGEHRHHRDAERREGEQLGRAEKQHDRTQERQGHRHQEGAEYAPHHGRHIGGAERAAGFAAARHRQAVEHGRGGAGAAGHAEHDRRDGIAGGRGRGETQEQREGRIGIHREGEGQQQRRARQAADAGQDAEHEPHDDAAGQHQ